MPPPLNPPLNSPLNPPLNPPLNAPSQPSPQHPFAHIVGQKELTFDQFYGMVSKLDAMAEENQGEIVDDGEEDDEDEEDEEEDEEDLREIAQTLFDELRGKAKTVTTTAISQMPDVIDLIEDGLLNKEELADLIQDINQGKKDLNFEQFYKVVSAIDAIADQAVRSFPTPLIPTPHCIIPPGLTFPNKYVYSTAITYMHAILLSHHTDRMPTTKKPCEKLPWSSLMNYEGPKTRYP